MLVKGKRTFDSLMNAICHHLTAEEDWGPSEDDDGPVFTLGEDWTATVVVERKTEAIYGVELWNEGYSELEIAVVEKAIGLLEGIKWSEETAKDIEGETKPKKRKRDSNHDDSRDEVEE